ncbi:hypothetical protein GY45DRAFT_265463 [Cubamyces sp. BRFM 1775]|nr:hypothetical protein GY45DRAFT_265463 [Cubamyces sp. BRFM 1775]
MESGRSRACTQHARDPRPAARGWRYRRPRHGVDNPESDGLISLVVFIIPANGPTPMHIAPEPRAQPSFASNPWAITPALNADASFGALYTATVATRPSSMYSLSAGIQSPPLRPIPSRAFFPSTPSRARPSCFSPSPIYPYLPSPSLPPSTCRSQHLLGRASAHRSINHPVRPTSPATHNQVNMHSSTTVAPCSPAPPLGTLDGRIADIRETFRRVHAISDALAFNLHSRPCAPAKRVRRRSFQPQTRPLTLRRVFLVPRRVVSLNRVEEHASSRVGTCKRVRLRSTTRREPRTPPLHLRARGTADRPGHPPPRSYVDIAFHIDIAHARLRASLDPASFIRNRAHFFLLRPRTQPRTGAMTTLLLGRAPSPGPRRFSVKTPD